MRKSLPSVQVSIYECNSRKFMHTIVSISISLVQHLFTEAIHFKLLFCFRIRCDVPYSECQGTDHKAECVCKKEFHGNGTVECIPDGFVEEENGKLCGYINKRKVCNFIYSHIYLSL